MLAKVSFSVFYPLLDIPNVDTCQSCNGCSMPNTQLTVAILSESVELSVSCQHESVLGAASDLLYRFHLHSTSQVLIQRIVLKRNDSLNEHLGC